MNEDNPFIPETPKPGISASSDTTPADRPESAISGIRDDSGSISLMKTAPITISCRAYQTKGFYETRSRIRFDLWKPSVIERGGIQFEEGKMYQIRGMIGNKCPFQVRHRASQNPHIYVFVPADEAHGIIPGMDYAITIEVVEENSRVTVLESGRGPSIMVFRTVLEALGIGKYADRSVVEYRLLNLSRRKEGEGPRRVFGNYSSQLGWVKLYVQSIGARVGDLMEVLGLRAYGLEDFVSDFNSKRPEALGNVRLGLDVGQRLQMQVDSRTIPLMKPEITAHGLKAILKAKIREEDHDGIKFEFDGEKVIPKLSNSSWITGFRSSPSGLNIGYEREQGQIYVWRVRLFGSPQKPTGRPDYSYLMEGVWVVSKPEEAEGMYMLEASLDTREHVISTLENARSYKHEKGNIAESMIKYLLPAMRFSWVADHPWCDDDLESDSCQHGPDKLAREIGTEDLYYVEVKWHVDFQKAYEEARIQVEEYWQKKHDHQGETVRGAYVAILHWDTENRIANLLFEKVLG